MQQVSHNKLNSCSNSEVLPEIMQHTWLFVKSYIYCRNAAISLIRILQEINEKHFTNPAVKNG